MASISIQNLSFCYEGSFDNIFENVSFTIDTDWKLGFIGRNGRGKTTLLKLLMGKYSYEGRIQMSNGEAAPVFDYFPFEVEDDTILSLEIAENILGSCESWKLLREIKKIGLTEDVLYRPYRTLSNGERTKIMIVSLFLKNESFNSNGVLLIDEPTNHLDMEARQAVAKYLNSKRGFILVSHDRAFLDECIDHVLSINKSTIEVMKGNYSSWQREKNRRDSYEISENERLSKEIADLQTAANRISEWSDRIEKTKIGFGSCDRGNVGAKSAKMMRHSKAQESRINRSIAEKEKLMHDVEYADSFAERERLKIHPEPYFKENLLMISGLSIDYGERTVVNGVSFSVKRGERIALMGKNGCGKSSILKLIQGYEIPHEGEVLIGSRLKISYVPQDMSFLNGSIDEFIASSGVDNTLFKTILRKFDFKRIQFEKDMSEFSMGQKKKVLLAKSLCENANIYIWDEPLNYIDVLSRLQIERLIEEFEPTMLFVEHDKAFVNKIATSKIEI